MVFSRELLIKGGAGLATAATGGTALYYGVDHFGNQLTKFDQGLIDHLRAGGNIQFAVLDGNNSGTALSNFPSLNGDQTIIATVKVTIDGNDAGTKGQIIEKPEAKGEEKGTKKYLKRLNGINDWTWSCEIKFNKTGANGATDLKVKDEIFKSGGEGFLNKLAKDTGGEKERNLKIKFIENCGKERGKDKNRKVNDANSLTGEIDDIVKPANELKSSKEFKLRKGNTENVERGGTEKETASNLYFVSESEFDTWFSVQK